MKVPTGQLSQPPDGSLLAALPKKPLSQRQVEPISVPRSSGSDATVFGGQKHSLMDSVPFPPVVLPAGQLVHARLLPTSDL